MIKIIKYILVICPIILSILLVVNITKYNEAKSNNKSIIESTNNYEVKINDNITKKEELKKEVLSLQEENKDKIWQYDRWIKWNKEIKEKIN